MPDKFTWTRSLPTNLVLNLARLGSLGSLKAPGTWGSLAGIGWYVLISFRLDMLVSLAITAAAAYIAVGICGEAEVRLQKRDPGEIVLDEFIAIPICFIGIPVNQFSEPWIILLIGFAVFRFFDIVKPLGIKRLQHLPGGTGVVMDDIAAALATCVVLHLGIGSRIW